MYVDGGDSSPLADVASLDERNGTAILEGLTFQGSPSLAVGATFPLITSYWNAHVYAAILDEGRRWSKQIFKPTAAFESNANDGGVERSTPTMSGKRRIFPNRTEGDPGVRIVPKGWDHEHCEICNDHIDEANPVAFVDQTNIWLCERCYEAFVERHDIAFVVDFPTPEP